MRIFVAYAAEDFSAAEEIAARLGAASHAVFFDRRSLKGGSNYDDVIRQEIKRCHIFVFLISPASVSPGQYALSELGFAAERWPNPTNVVLPLVLRPTPMEQIPAYLRSVTLFRPVGNASAELGARIAAMALARQRRRIRLAGLIAICIVGLAMIPAYRKLQRHADQHLTTGPVTQQGSDAPQDPGNGDLLSLFKGVVALPEKLRHRVRAATLVNGAFLVALDDPPEIGNIGPADSVLKNSDLVTGSPVDLVAVLGSNRTDALLVTTSPDLVYCVDTKNHDVPTTLCYTFPDAISSAKPGENTQRFSTKPSSVANRGDEIWVLTRPDGSRQSGLFMITPDRKWHTPAYQIDNDMSFDLNGVRLCGSPSGRLFGVTAETIPNDLYEFTPDRFTLYDGHNHSDTTGDMKSIVPGTQALLLGLDSDFAPLEFDPQSDDVINIRHRGPKLGALFSTADWDNPSLSAAGGHVVAGMTQWLRGNDYHALQSRVADLVPGQTKWRRLFTLDQCEVVHVQTDGIHCLLIVRDRSGSYDSYWLDLG
jgi:hypothetical protein